MKLAYSTNAYMRFTLEETIRRVAGLGYAGIELMADAPHAWPADLCPRDIDDMLRWLNNAGLAISNINAFMMNKINDRRQPYWHPSWIEPDNAYRRIRIEHTMRSLTLARELGVPHITTEPGGPVPTPAERATAMTTFVEMLKPVLDHAADVNVTLLVEPEPGLLLENTNDYLELQDRLNSPHLALNYDVGHFFCVGEPLGQTIRRLASDIRHVHIEDIAATREHHHLVPGDGQINFSEVFTALDEIGYHGWVTVELYPFVDDPDTAGARARQNLLTILEAL